MGSPSLWVLLLAIALFLPTEGESVRTHLSSNRRKLSEERGNENLTTSAEQSNNNGEEKSERNGGSERDPEKQSMPGNSADGENLVVKEKLEGSGGKKENPEVANVEGREVDPNVLGEEKTDIGNANFSLLDQNVTDDIGRLKPETHDSDLKLVEKEVSNNNSSSESEVKTATIEHLSLEREENVVNNDDLSAERKENVVNNEGSSPEHEEKVVSNEGNDVVKVDNEDVGSKEERSEQKNEFSSEEDVKKVEGNGGSQLEEEESEPRNPQVVLELGVGDTGKPIAQLESKDDGKTNTGEPVAVLETKEDAVSLEMGSKNPPVVSEDTPNGESEPGKPLLSHTEEESLESSEFESAQPHNVLEASREVTESSDVESVQTQEVLEAKEELLKMSEGDGGDQLVVSEANETETSVLVSEAKPPADEFQNVTNEIESQLEEMNRGGFDQTESNPIQGQRDPSSEDYDIMQELADLPSKLHETAGKVADHLRPDVLKWTGTSKEYFDIANQQITESFSPLVGRQMAPFLATIISFAILLLPLVVVVYLFEHIKALVSLEKTLFFMNAYLASYFTTLWVSSFIIGIEPMYFFYKNTPASSFISLQLLQALAYGVYLIFTVANVIYTFALGRFVARSIAVVQWTLATAISLHYYVTVFHPSIASKPPHTSSKAYAAYTFVFLVLCLFARIRLGKNPYISFSANGGGIASKNR